MVGGVEETYGSEDGDCVSKSWELRLCCIFGACKIYKERDADVSDGEYHGRKQKLIESD